MTGTAAAGQGGGDPAVAHQQATPSASREEDDAQREPGGEVSYLELATLPSAPFWARRQTKTTLKAWELWPDTIETAELLVSELVTNALNVSGPEPGRRVCTDLDGVQRISLTLRLLPGRVVIEVCDNDPNPPVLTNAGAGAESGRGLMLVQALCKEWGHYSHPSGGKTVFCVLSAAELARVSGSEVEVGPGEPCTR